LLVVVLGSILILLPILWRILLVLSSRRYASLIGGLVVLLIISLRIFLNLLNWILPTLSLIIWSGWSSKRSNINVRIIGRGSRWWIKSWLRVGINLMRWRLRICNRINWLWRGLWISNYLLGVWLIYWCLRCLLIWKLRLDLLDRYWLRYWLRNWWWPDLLRSFLLLNLLWNLIDNLLSLNQRRRIN